MKELLSISYLMIVQSALVSFKAISQVFENAGKITHVYFNRLADRHDVKYGEAPSKIEVLEVPLGDSREVN